DGNNAIGRDVTHIYTTANTYTVTLTFCTSQIQHDILVNPLPLAFAGQDTISCEDVPFDLSTMPLPPFASNYSSILWYGGLGTFNNSNIVGPTYTPEDNEFGFVTLYMVAYGIAPCYNDTSSMIIEIILGAYAFAGSDEDHCQGEPFDFATSSSPPQAWNENFRMWSGGAGFFVDPTAEVPVYIPAPGEVGPVQLTFIASNVLNCDSIDDMILNIHPVYIETQFFEICYGDSIQLPGGSWVSTSGVYSDTLMSVWNCDSVIGTTVSVLPQIDADFIINPNDSTCIGESVSFTKTGTANLVSWLWDFGDGTTSSDPNPGHAYSTVGSFTVSFSYTDDLGCSDQISHNVYVFEHPDVDFTTNVSSACINAEFIFYGLSSDIILSWEWDFGDGSTGSGQNVTHIYTTYGAHQVTLTVTATNLCQSTITKTIFVAEPPTADFTYNIYKCDTIQFTDLSTAPQGYFLVEWEWDFGDGSTSNLQHPSHVFSSGGIYQVTMVVFSDSAGLICPDSITKPVLVPARPTVYFTWTPEPTCLGEATTFFGTSGIFINEWYWDFDDGNFAT
ncbi:MAG: PKD domain-containing protein, partial [Bacteroidales bacterium]|nr:PKD domain-containing protein [Bacteroidales bacterium]